jgi:hypothetical protein
MHPRHIAAYLDRLYDRPAVLTRTVILCYNDEQEETVEAAEMLPVW